MSSDRTGIDEAIEQLRSLPIVEDILCRLEENLPSDLVYHNVLHTIDVLEESIKLAFSAGISRRDLELLAIAAAFHDAGFLQGPMHHEITGARMVRIAMHSNGSYSKCEIDAVKAMILDTRLIDSADGIVQHPSSELSCYLLDADLANVGREDFFEKLDLQKLETRSNQALAFKQAYSLLKNHKWHTDAACLLYDSQKKKNISLLKKKLRACNAEIKPAITRLRQSRLRYLAQLPLLLNSSLHLQQVISLVLEHIKQELKAEAVSVLLLDNSGERLTFWALKGGASVQLKNKQMLAEQGIVGWVLANQVAALVPDVSKDARFFSSIDQDSRFKTKSMLCVPLTARRHTALGAIQVINSLEPDGFTQEDLYFLEQFASQTAIAIENVKLRESVQARNARLELIDQRKDQMIKLLGNSLISPISDIVSSCEKLADPGHSAKEQLQITSKMRASCQQVEELLERVQSLALLDNHDILPNRQSIQLAALIDVLHEKYAYMARTHGVKLQSEVSTKAGEIDIDVELMLLALGNLIQNAIEATPSGGSVLIRSSITGDLAQIEISDTGVGIPEAELPFLFDKFFQTESCQNLEQKQTDSSKHLGIGLAIAQGIIRAHDAVLEVASKPGKGTVFYFTLKTNATHSNSNKEKTGKQQQCFSSQNNSQSLIN